MAGVASIRAVIVVVTIHFLGDTALASSKTVSNIKCGIRPQSRVVGGKDAGIWPWQAQMQVYWNNTYLFNCGAVVINDEWILSAAHCVAHFYQPFEVRILVGDYDRTKNETSERIYYVKEIRHHFNFSAGQDVVNDIAMLKLKTKIQFTSKVQPICLPKQNQRVAVGKKCYLTGWGRQYAGSPTSDILQEVQLPVVSHSDCQRGNSHQFPVDDTSMICAGYGSKSNASGCHGDSGGPFSCSYNGIYTLAGIVSWGDFYCKTVNNTYSVFTRVSSFIDWIHDQMTTPAPVYPTDKDSHWYCAEWKKKKYCTYDGLMKFLVRLYCPVSCNVTSKTKYHMGFAQWYKK